MNSVYAVNLCSPTVSEFLPSFLLSFIHSSVHSLFLIFFHLCFCLMHLSIHWLTAWSNCILHSILPYITYLSIKLITFFHWAFINFSVLIMDDSMPSNLDEPKVRNKQCYHSNGYFLFIHHQIQIKLSESRLKELPITNHFFN